MAAHGEQFALMSGLQIIQKWFVSKLDSHLEVMDEELYTYSSCCSAFVMSHRNLE